jgi:alpha-D-ribose 1-methylphosphonate 5-triphosphate synthase subunit PhnL
MKVDMETNAPFSHELAFAQRPALMLHARGVSKTFTLHQQGGVRITALNGISLDVERGECVALSGRSGAGKSTLLRCLYGNYLTSAGTIAIRDDSQPSGCLTLGGASPQDVLRLRRTTLGYVSQFLRVIPRGVEEDEARERAGRLLERLNLPRRLWSLAPATFSGGEQQRVNIARGLIADHPLLLLDEPTASLDAENRDVAAELLVAERQRGIAIVGIFHDEITRERVATRAITLQAGAAHPSSTMETLQTC